MEPNAREIFSHTDEDGDAVRILGSDRDRLTMSIRQCEEGQSYGAYLSRAGVAVLRDALAKWLDESGAEESTADAPEWSDAEAPYRLEALKLAVQLAPGGATESAVFSVAEQMVHWLVNGERMPVDVPPLLTFIDAAPTQVTQCGVCRHPFHGTALCADGAPGTAYADRCQCRGRAEDYRR